MKPALSSLLFLFFFNFLTAQTTEEKINNLLDNWHLAAAKADSDGFFGAMTEEAHYLGTDESEDWKREEMRVWAKPFFDSGKAWDFKKKTRHIYVYQDGKLAWFDENLDTWMGPCRGSGVVVLTKDGWKIQQYVLSVLVPNDKIDAYLELK